MSGTLLHIADRVLNRPLMIHPDKLTVIASVLDGRIGIDGTFLGAPEAEQLKKLAPGSSRFVGSFEPNDPKNPTAGRKPYRTTADGIAIIPIMGSLVNRGAWIGAFSGIQSYEGLKYQLAAAAADPKVTSIILDMDSPGGEAVGAFEAGDAVAAAAREPGMMRRAAGAVGRGAANGMALAGPGILHGNYEAAKSGAEMQSEIVKMRAAGIPQADIDRAWAESGSLTAKYTNVKRADALERFKELRSIILHPEEAHELLPAMVQAASAMNAIDRSGEMAGGLGYAARGAEVLGRAQDPKKFAAYLDSFIRAQQVMGKTITPEMQFEFAKYAKSSGATLSDRFLTTTGVSLAQELGGQTTGQSIDQFVKQITGGFQGNQHSAAKEFVAMGLAKKSDFDLTKTGEIKGMKHGHKVPGWQMAQSDPDQWVYQYLLPAFAKNHITDLGEQIAQVRRMFPAGRSADFVSKLIQQRQSFENHAKLYGEAAGGAAAAGINRSDPFVALNSLTTSLENFAGVLTQPAMQTASGVLNNLADTFGSWQDELSKFAKENPTAAKWIGGGALAAGLGGGAWATGSLFSGLMNGFGLGASATALDGSAAALSAAAAELSAASGGKLAGDLLGKGAGFGAGALAGGVVPAAAAASLLLPAWAGWEAYQTNKQLPAGTMPSGIAGGDGDMAWAAQWAEAKNSRPIFPSPGITQSMLYGTGHDAEIQAQLSGSAEVHGEAKLTVEASSTLIQIAKQAQDAIRLIGTLHANGPGSLGHSSPDAAAPPPASTGGATGDW